VTRGSRKTIQKNHHQVNSTREQHISEKTKKKKNPDRKKEGGQRGRVKGKDGIVLKLCVNTKRIHARTGKALSPHAIRSLQKREGRGGQDERTRTQLVFVGFRRFTTGQRGAPKERDVSKREAERVCEKVDVKRRKVWPPMGTGEMAR